MKHTTHISLRRSILAIAIAIAGTSCSINMQHKPLKDPAVRRSGAVSTALAATGIDGRVGWGTFTAFFIPIVPVHVEGDGNRAVMSFVNEALKKAGYDVRGGGSGGKVLQCDANLSYWNYTWLFPIVPTWGSSALNVSLVENGQVLWSKKFKGRGATLNFFNGYTSSNRQAMTKVLNEMVDAFASDDFRAALGR
ncbi:MAG: hypothetical protein JNG86_07215 [Verrucomicrobiaceae bacterium]|nr:hypothetical protein [Verrucomicrobiaceae bacterium]